jgi:glycosyltransferase involved in cell wall biosynthesis
MGPAATVPAVGEMLVSVVVPTRNRAGMLRDLLESLAAQSLDASRFEVIVVDDGSTDETGEVLNSATDNLQLRAVRQEQGGPASARNRGWRMASADLVAFTDDDCRATPHWLENLLEAAARHPGAMLQGRTEIDPDQENHAGPFSRTLEITEAGPFYATCNMLYPRALLERLGGFNESYPLHGAEDTDLGWRAREAGASDAFVPDAVIHHAVVDLGPLGKLRWALGWSETMQVFRRHRSLRRMLTWGLFWKRSHALLTVALLGVLMARRFPPASLLALPYLRQLRARYLVHGYRRVHLPYLALYDLVETYAAARGAIKHRVPVL